MFKAVFLSAMLFCFCAEERMVDLRARSMQGRQAHPQGVAVRPKPVVYRRADAPQSAAAENQKAENSLVSLSAQSETQGGIKQTGLKIFKEEDEDKVLKIDVDNPEFDRLSDRRKQNILSRISYEEK